jgi:release factor glutamine methyltransferase
MSRQRPVKKDQPVLEALRGARRFIEPGGAPASDADMLVQGVCGADKAGLWAHPERRLSAREARRLNALLTRRKTGTPVQYLLGETWFCGLRMKTRPGVFIPRPETEMLAEAGADFLVQRPAEKEALTALDLCTGSGCIAVTLAVKCPGVHVTAVDRSGRALKAAKENARLNGVEKRVQVKRGDLFEGLDRRYDLITSNPPYIPDADVPGLQKEVLKEPGAALKGGADGLDFYQRLAAGAAGHLKPGGMLLMETGFDQAEAVKAIFDKGFLTKIYNDFNGIGRVVEARTGRGQDRTI